MGIRKRTYYTVECNHCGKLLEDDAGELVGLTTKREQAVRTAEQYGWFCIGKDTWRCTDYKEDWDS